MTALSMIGIRYLLNIDLSKTAFVEQAANGLEIRIPIRDERFNKMKHVDCRFVQTNENSVVQLTQSQQFKYLACGLLD